MSTCCLLLCTISTSRCINGDACAVGRSIVVSSALPTQSSSPPAPPKVLWRGRSTASWAAPHPHFRAAARPHAPTNLADRIRLTVARYVIRVQTLYSQYAYVRAWRSRACSIRLGFSYFTHTCELGFSVCCFGATPARHGVGPAYAPWAKLSTDYTLSSGSAGCCAVVSADCI